MKLPSLAPSYDYIPGLNGLRACAVLLVLTAHIGFSQMVPGGFGVTLFFFISGMLITRLLLAEYQDTHHIDIIQFYIRRLLRLYPALMAAVIIGAMVYWFAGGLIDGHKIAAALLYYINFYGIEAGFGQGRTGFDPFSVLWSLAIEQQYYLFFPLIILPFINNKKSLTIVLTLLILFVTLWRSYLHFTGASSDLIYMRTDTRIDSILYGCLLSVILSTRIAPQWVKITTHPVIFIAALLSIIASFLIRNDHFRDTIRYTIQGIALFPILTTLCFSDRISKLTRLLECLPLRRIGAWSYSLYLFHPIAIVIAETIWGPGSLGIHTLPLKQYVCFALTAIPLAFILAIASYYGIEKPVMKLRHHFGSHAKG